MESTKSVQLYFAPLEGITYPQYRSVHFRIFGGVDCYYAPFIPTGIYDRKFLLKHFPDREEGIPLVPQLVANDSGKFIDTVKTIRDFGYEEVNLNAGCPSSTVFSKYKGSGMLRDLSTLDAFLSNVFENTPAQISIKTRMGISSVMEFSDILPIYNRYPIKLLTIHARSRASMYSGHADIFAFLSAFRDSISPVSYNGDIFSSKDYDQIIQQVPNLHHVMIGRGAVANPALFRIIRGGEALKTEELVSFTEALIEEYLSSGLPPSITAERLKALWAYMICLFPGSAKEYKNLKKAHSLEAYLVAQNSLISNCRFDGSAFFRSI